MRSSILGLAFFLSMSSLAAHAQPSVQRMPLLSRVPAPLGAMDHLTCDNNVKVELLNVGALISCWDQKTGQFYAVNVPQDNEPSPAEVAAYIQPVVMARRMLGYLDKSFDECVILDLNKGQVTGVSTRPCH